MDYFSLGMHYCAIMNQPDRAGMTRADRRAAFRAAEGSGRNLGHSVTITVKDEVGKDVVLTMGQSEFIAFVAGFQPV
ncbi:hypothetical protein [Paraburkholderia sediminicola]|uniref:hypothetical protein n=1 Tax=Paraburkholderia sediminicola TaxID=458836 RepID=UPI0038BA5F74